MGDNIPLPVEPEPLARCGGSFRFLAAPLSVPNGSRRTCATCWGCQEIRPSIAGIFATQKRA